MKFWIAQPPPKFFLFILLTAALLASSWQLRADDELTVTILDPFAEMYIGPGRGYPIFHVIERGETATLLRRRTDWIKVRTSRDREGWVRREALNLTLGPDNYLVEFTEATVEDYRTRRWSGGFAAGDFAGADALSAYLGFRFTDNLSTEFKVTQAIGSFSSSIVVGVSLLHETYPEWRVSPFFSLGAGAITTKPDATLVQTEDRTDAIMMVGIGAHGYVSRQFMLRMEYTNNLILTSRDEHERVNEWKIGLNIFF